MKSGRRTKGKTDANKQAAIDYLNENISAKFAELAEYVGLRTTRMNELLREMTAEGTVVAEGSVRNRVYRLK
jgi:ATP-dependent DNA helicase RecG